jgi:acetoin:2,6-dichlorophenolindophenol oxidoreductase subunit alpha
MNFNLSKELTISIYKKLKLCRRFEEKVIELVNSNEIYGTTHEYVGEEAVAVGICTALNKEDYIMSTHRGHGHMVAIGADIKYMFSELMGKANGYNGGKGGSMHIAEPEIGILGANGIVGAGMPIAVGAALALKIDKKKNIIVSFYGDGAANQGVVHESMNLAAIWELPVLFVCENNMYAVSTPAIYSSKIKNLSERAKAYGFEGFSIDGMNVLEVYNTVKQLIEKIRNGRGPFLLECKTYRYSGHFTAEPILGLNYRTEEEINFYKSKDPIMSFKNMLVGQNICSPEELNEIDHIVDNELQEAVDFARNSKFPEPEDALKDMYSTVFEGIPQKGWSN